MTWLDPEPIVLRTLAGLAGLLAACSILLFPLRRRLGEPLARDLRDRLVGWWIMVAVFGVAMVLPARGTIVFFALVSTLALREYLALIDVRRADLRVTAWAYLAIPVQYALIAAGWYGLFIVFVPVFVFLFLPFRMILIGETAGYVRAVGTLQWGLMTMVFCLGHLAWLLVMPAVEQRGPGFASGPALVLYVIGLTQLNDVAQYVWGKSFGRHKVVPTVSPNKTWEGMIGGVLTTVVLAWLAAPLFTPFGPGHALAAGALIGLGGFVGDCAMASLKRDVGVKDASSMIPGHGGVIDRVNSLIYTAPLFTHFVRFFYF